MLTHHKASAFCMSASAICDSCSFIVFAVFCLFYQCLFKIHNIAVNMVQSNSFNNCHCLMMCCVVTGSDGAVIEGY